MMTVLNGEKHRAHAARNDVHVQEEETGCEVVPQ